MMEPVRMYNPHLQEQQQYMLQNRRTLQHGLLNVRVFTLNRYVYPTKPVHPVSDLVPYPREILLCGRRL